MWITRNELPTLLLMTTITIINSCTFNPSKTVNVWQACTELQLESLAFSLVLFDEL
jgi:outer membrane lipopolysaccharide assembly protein LptE/RlpB